jgi:hypothetical protein
VGFLKEATSELGGGVVESSDPTMILTRSKSRVSSVHHQERQKTGGRGQKVYLFDAVYSCLLATNSEQGFEASSKSSIWWLQMGEVNPLPIDSFCRLSSSLCLLHSIISRVTHKSKMATWLFVVGCWLFVKKYQ